MNEPVKAKRRYDSSRRRQQAAETRIEILAAAQRRFERALKTVYVAFETKSGVLRGLWNLRLRGDDDSVPIARQAWYREVLDEPDPHRKLALNARNSRAGKTRIGPLFEVIRSAAPLDPDIQTLWRRIGTEYHANQRAIVESLDATGALKPDLDVASATDILWTINHPTTWHLLVTERGWTHEQYERWCAEAACAQLLRGS